MYAVIQVCASWALVCPQSVGIYFAIDFGGDQLQFLPAPVRRSVVSIVVMVLLVHRVTIHSICSGVDGLLGGR